MRGKKKKKGIVLPEFIGASCGRTVRGGFTERGRDEGEVTKERKRRREEGEQQFD